MAESAGRARHEVVTYARPARPARPRRRPRRPVLHGVDISVGKGETVGIVGESGSGKTTLGRALLGLVMPAAGSVLFDGVDITHARRAREAAAAPAHADDLPGPDVLAQSAAYDRTHPDRAGSAPRPGKRPGGGARAGARRARSRRPRSRHGRPLLLRAFRRPAPARRHRPRRGAAARFRARRRDRLGARRLDPGAGAASPSGADARNAVSRWPSSATISRWSARSASASM